MLNYLLILTYSVSAIQVLWTLFLLVSIMLTPYKKVNPVCKYKKKVGILLPYFNDAASIQQTLDALADNDVSFDVELVLINDCSTDNSKELVDQWISLYKPYENKGMVIKHVTTISNYGKKVFPLIHGYKELSADVDSVIVLDGDTFIRPGALNSLVNRFYSIPNCAGVCGNVLIELPAESNFLAKLQYAEHEVNYAFSKYGRGLFNNVLVTAGAFSIHSKKVLDEIGIWETDWLVEDIAWTARAIGKGYKIGFETKAIATTLPPTTYNALFRQRRRWARGRVEALIESFKTKKDINFLVRLSGLMSMAIEPIFLYLIFSGHFEFIVITALVIMINVLGNQAVNNKVYGFNRGFVKILKESLLFYVLNLIMLPATLSGLYDGMVNREKKWLTR